MRIFLKHIIRNIKENIGRTFLIIISLFGVGLLLSLSLGMVFSIKSFWNSLSNSFMGGYNYMVYPVTEEKLSIDRIKSVGVEFDYLGVSDYSYGYIKNEKNEFVSTPLLGLNIQQSIKMKMIEFKEEKNIVLNDNEIIVSSSVASKYKLEENKQIQYYDENGSVHNLVVKYIAKDSGAFLQELSFVSNEQTFLKLIGEDKMPYEYFCLNYLGNKTMSVLTEELNNIEDDYGMNFISVEAPSLYVTFGYILKIGIIALLLILIVVYFTLNSIVKIIISERIPIIGSFRSIGASVKKMNLILLMEMAIYGLIGGVLGSVAGVGFTKALFLLFEMMEDTMSITIEMVSFETYGFLIIILTIVMLVLFQIGLSISEILKSSKLSIKECIFNKHESIYKYSINKLLFGFFFLTSAVF